MIARLIGWLLRWREAWREIGRTERHRGGGRLLDRSAGPPRPLP